LSDVFRAPASHGGVTSTADHCCGGIFGELEFFPTGDGSMGHPRDFDKTQKMFAYMRFGLYWVLKGHEPWHNFCDVHQIFSNGPQIGDHSSDDIHLYYTGPKESIKGIKTYRRSSLHEKVFVQNNDGLMRELDLENGGDASAIVMKRAKTYDLWLFGPLTFLGATYGTLLVSLEGFHSPVSHTKWRKPPLEPLTDIRWPVGNSHFHPCKIYGFDYAEYPLGAERPNKQGWSEVDFDNHIQEIGSLTVSKKDLTPVPLPDFAKGAAWKVEANSGSATQDECFNQCG
jgi:hypothetical protein